MSDLVRGRVHPLRGQVGHLGPDAVEVEGPVTVDADGKLGVLDVEPDGLRTFDPHRDPNVTHRSANEGQTRFPRVISGQPETRSD
jgi:hypothetical protein